MEEYIARALQLAIPHVIETETRLSSRLYLDLHPNATP